MISCFTWFGYELPVKERIRLIKHAGFDGVMLWWSEEYENYEYRKAPQMARDAGLFVENIHTSFGSINDLWLDNLDGDTLTEFFLQIADDCFDHEIPAMVMHLSRHSPPPVSEAGLKRIMKITERAERHGVNVAFENLRDNKYIEAVLTRINSPHAGFCYDSGHHNCTAPNEDLLQRYGARLLALHLHDNDGTGDQHRLPFDGTIDWPATMKLIKQSGYTGAVALESENFGYKDMQPEDFLRLAYERAKRLENML